MSAQQKKLPEYAIRLAEEMRRCNVGVRKSGTRPGLAEQSGLPPARIERILDGAVVTEKEHKAMCRGLGRLKHYSALLLEYRNGPLSEKAIKDMTMAADNDQTDAVRAGHGHAVKHVPGLEDRPMKAPPMPQSSQSQAPKATKPVVHIAPAPDSKASTPTPEMTVETMPASPLKLKYNTKGMYTKVEDLNADDARLYLHGNVINRVLKSKHVEFLAKEMIEGRWKLTHQGIAFDSESRLLDGQHRLHAIIHAFGSDPKATVKMNVAYNVDPKSFMVIDTANSPRSLSDVWTLAEKSGDSMMLPEDDSGGASNNKRQVIAALRTLRLMMSGSIPPRWSAGELTENFRAFPEISAASKIIGKHRPSLGRSGFLAGIAYVLPVEDMEMVSDFVKKVSTRVGMDNSHAAFLRCYDNLCERSGKHGIADTNLALCAVTIRALHARKKGRSIDRIFIKDVKDINLSNDDSIIYYRTLRSKSGLTVM